ncbi:SURF1 family protein [Haliea sp. E17]|uniref:SURF1 family protein n=1 Tax=Haliea sp. E17 TaxID=3401576 RepID=UPI003AAA860B
MSSRLQFDFEWRITLFTLCLLPLLISLGFWQLQRAAEKQLLAGDFARKQAQAPVSLAELGSREPGYLSFLPVRLEGHFRPEQNFLLDNRMHGGHYGNEVLTVFELVDGTLVLVNRGWVPADPARLEATLIPALPESAVGSAITGQVYVAPGKPYVLSEDAVGPGWPKTLQSVDMQLVAKILGAAPFPYSVRIDADQPAALQADWQVINISPAKHRGYAFQWFSMAVVLLLLYLFRSTNLWQLIRGAQTTRADDE